MSTKRRGIAGSEESSEESNVARAEPPTPSGPPTAPRRPQQERGQRRVDAILDAAAATIVEEGIGGVTMHGVARRSDTTTGSMYHFFPDREALLDGLAERHARAIRERMAAVERDTAEQWSSLGTEEAVGRFLDPFLAYVAEHRDLPALIRRARAAEPEKGGDTELYRLVIRLAEAVVASRMPRASKEELRSRAFTFLAMATGVMTAGERASARARGVPPPAALHRELRRALVAYLDSYAPRGS